MSDPYSLLGVSRDSTKEEVRKAYHDLVRRWHPDRFAEGPERAWAEEKMIAINLAYEEVIHGAVSQDKREGDPQLENVRKLLGENQLSQAKQALLRIAQRSAEWNYLFGAVLFRLGEVEKSLLYFSIATQAYPENQQYHSAYVSAESVLEQNKSRFTLERFFKNVRKNSK